MHICIEYAFVVLLLLFVLFGGICKISSASAHMVNASLMISSVGILRSDGVVEKLSLTSIARNFSL